MCDSRVGEDVAHVLVGCGEFERDQLALLDDAGSAVSKLNHLPKINSRTRLQHTYTVRTRKKQGKKTRETKPATPRII